MKDCFRNEAQNRRWAWCDMTCTAKKYPGNKNRDIRLVIFTALYADISGLNKCDLSTALIGGL